MKPNSLGLSIFVGAIFSTFITSIYVLMRTVPALLGQGCEAGGLGEAIGVWFILTFLFSFLMHEWQKALDEFNKRGRKDSDKDKSDGDSESK